MIRGKDSWFIQQQKLEADKKMAEELENNLMRWTNEIKQSEETVKSTIDKTTQIIHLNKISKLTNYVNEAERRLEFIYTRITKHNG